MKKKFEVLENETINECLDRMNTEGYTPIRRIEKPIFKEEGKKGESKYVPIAQKIIFEGMKNT
ncbi:NETI motif-containing protein [Bacillus sp. FSL K6-3431]|uniref:NETI motif-containing protein n=1 Tax=Bacillus sp. FSL K6-3431 TaxID=2921500 RepID=UPI0030F70F97